MNRNNLWLMFALAGSVAFGGLASAQDVSDQSAPAPAYVSVIEGVATLVRDGRAEAVSANLPLLEGDRLRTDAGRLEVFMPDGSLLHLDQNTTVDLLSGSLMRLASGRVIFIVSGRPDERPSLDYQIDGWAGSVRIDRPGEYRVSLVQGSSAPDLELAVVRGEAALLTQRGSVGVRAGQFSTASDGYAPAYPDTFNSARLDAFGQWSADQLDAHLGYSSQQYLPPEVQVYSGTFDRYGTWDDVQPYGYVWYPTVQVGWRPYYDGYWRTVGPYGWTWIGYDPWCWPTHHYGRWGIGARGWFWIPGRSWGSAWVSWGIGTSYVSWCPLGWNNAPVLSLTFVNDYYHSHRYDPWSAWTVVPRNAFGDSARVATVALRGDAQHAALNGGVAVQRAAPPVQMRAAARPFGAADGTISGRAVPRGSIEPATGGSTLPTAVPRAFAGQPGLTSSSAFQRPGTAAARTEGAINGLPPRDPRPSMAERSSSSASPRVPDAAVRSNDVSATTYGRTQGYAANREAGAPVPSSRGVVRSPESTSNLSSGRQVAQPGRTSETGQHNNGNADYWRSVPVYKGTILQNNERSDTPATERSPVRSYAPMTRSVPSAPAYEQRAPAPAAVPRAQERSYSAPVGASPPSRPERVSPPAGQSAPPRSSAPSVSRPPQQSAPARGGAQSATPHKR